MEIRPVQKKFSCYHPVCKIALLLVSSFSFHPRPTATRANRCRASLPILHPTLTRTRKLDFTPSSRLFILPSEALKKSAADLSSIHPLLSHPRPHFPARLLLLSLLAFHWSSSFRRYFFLFLFSCTLSVSQSCSRCRVTAALPISSLSCSYPSTYLTIPLPPFFFHAFSRIFGERS